MSRGDLDPKPSFGTVILRAPPNWTAVGSLGLLGLAHLTIASLALIKGRWEGYLSVVLGCVFLIIAAVATRCRFEIALLGEQRRVRTRTGWGRFCFEYYTPFAQIRGVRLIQEAMRKRPTECRIELLAPYEDIECPPTRTPQQDALFLAMLLDVPLIKVSEDAVPSESSSDRIDQMHTRV